jgi:hypothetical protein
MDIFGVAHLDLLRPNFALQNASLFVNALQTRRPRLEKRLWVCMVLGRKHEQAQID